MTEDVVPIYEYKCKKCRRVTEKWFNIHEIKDRIKCSCGTMAKRILSRNSVLTDGDVKWLESARQTLQPDHERPIFTRAEHKQYLKDHHLECIG
jgi:putative FmdB family regulatory protein